MREIIGNQPVRPDRRKLIVAGGNFGVRRLGVLIFALWVFAPTLSFADASDVDAIVTSLLVERTSDLAAVGKVPDFTSLETDMLHDAVTYLVDRSARSDASPRLTDAIASMRRGHAKQAAAILTNVMENSGEEISNQAAAAQYLGTLLALYDARKAVAAFRRAAELDPDNPRTWYGLGNAALDAETYETAQDAFAHMLRLSEQAGDTRGQGLALIGAGMVHDERSEDYVALAKYQQANATLRGLPSRDTEESSHQQDLAVSYDKLADIQREIGEYADAEENQKIVIELIDQFVLADPQNLVWLRWQVVNQSKITVTVLAQVRIREALESQTQAHALYMRLADLDPSNLGWRRSILLSHMRMASINRLRGRPDVAIEHYNRRSRNLRRLARIRSKSRPMATGFFGYRRSARRHI